MLVCQAAYNLFRAGKAPTIKAAAEAQDPPLLPQQLHRWITENIPKQSELVRNAEGKIVMTIEDGRRSESYVYEPRPGGLEESYRQRCNRVQRNYRMKLAALERMRAQREAQRVTMSISPEGPVPTRGSLSDSESDDDGTQYTAASVAGGSWTG